MFRQDKTLRELRRSYPLRGKGVLLVIPPSWPSLRLSPARLGSRYRDSTHPTHEWAAAANSEPASKRQIKSTACREW